MYKPSAVELSDDGLPRDHVKDRLFKGPAYRDAWAALLFLAHLVALIGGAGYVVGSGRAFDETTWFPWVSEGPTPHGALSEPSCVSWGQPQAQALGVTALVTVVAGVLVAASWLTLAAKHPLGFLQTLLAGYVLLIFGSFVAQVAMLGFHPASLLLLLLIPLYAWWWQVLWRRAPFSATILQTACKTVMDHKMTIVVAFFFMVLSVMYKGIWILSLNLTTQQWHLYPLILVLFWSELVFMSLAHTTVCGVTATDFFIPEGVPNPVWGAFRRTCTYSLGSVCLGSAVVAVLRFLRFLTQRARQVAEDRNNAALLVITCCFEFLFSCVESLMQYFNHYAFVQVAMYGKSFTQAARDTWTLVKTHGIDAVLNDMITHTAFGMCNVLSALLAAVACGVPSYYLSHSWWGNCSDSSDSIAAYTFMTAAAAAVAVLFIQGVVFSVLDSAVVTFFVCIAEEPQVLAFRHPELEMAINRRINLLRNP